MDQRSQVTETEYPQQWRWVRRGNRQSNRSCDACSMTTEGCSGLPSNKEACTHTLYIAFIGVWVLHMHFNLWRTNNGTDTARCISGANGIWPAQDGRVVCFSFHFILFYFIFVSICYIHLFSNTFSFFTLGDTMREVYSAGKSTGLNRRIHCFLF